MTGSALEGNWPLVGRSSELEALLGYLVDGGGTAVVLAGPAGVGKSRLLSELASKAADTHAVVTCTATASLASIRFGVFAPFLRPNDELPVALRRSDVLRRFSDSLEQLAGPRRLVLIVDDAHLLDDGSAALIQLMATTDQALVAVAIRAGAPAPDGITCLWKDGLAERIEVGPLSERQVHELLVEVLGGPVDRATARRIWRASSGSPLFLRELVLAGLESDRLTNSGGVWSWQGTLDVGPRVSELFQPRLGPPNSPLRRLLEVLSISAPLDVRLLVGVCGAEAIEIAERAGSIRVESLSGGTDLVTFAHPLIGEAVRAQMPFSQLAWAARRLADVAAELPVTEDLLRLATWRLLARDRHADPELVLTGARRALAVSDHELAEQLADLAAECGAGVPARLVRAEALFWQGRFVDAEEAFRSIDDQIVDDPDLARAAIVRASALFWGLGRADEAAAVLVSAEHRVDDRALLLDLQGERASQLFFHGRPIEALALAEQVVDDHDAPLSARLRAASAAVAAWAVTGHLGKTLSVSAESLPQALASASELPQLAGELAMGRCLGMVLGGLLSEADELAESLYDQAASSVVDDYRGAWALFSGRVALAAGRLGDAGERLREASAQLRRHDPASLLSWCLALSAEVDALRGETSHAEAKLDEAAAVANPAVLIDRTDRLLALSWVHASVGRHALAVAAATEAADAARTDGVRAAEAVALHALVRLDRPGSIVDRLVECASVLDGPLPAAYSDHARAHVASDGLALGATAEQFEECGALLLAAEAWADAAEAFAAAGRHASRLSATAQGRRLLARCQGARPPSVASLVGVPELAALTRREREIVELAGRGLTNREIGQRLYVSVRTVNNHLNHAYAKLGLSDREALRGLLEGEDLAK